MFSRHPCISFVAAAFIIVVGTFSTAGTSDFATANQNLQEISNAIHQLTKRADTHLFQCPSVDYELAVSIGNLRSRSQNAVNQIAYLKERLQEEEAIVSQIQEDSRDIEEKLLHQADKRSCRSPFYQVGDDCLYVNYAQSKSWEDARKFCRAIGGDLAVPSDVNKLRELLSAIGENSFWIGGTDHIKEGDWRWLNGSKVDLSVNWVEGQPNNLDNKEHCLHCYQHKNWLLDDHTCHTGKNFVCQDAVYEE